MFVSLSTKVLLRILQDRLTGESDYQIVLSGRKGKLSAELRQVIGDKTLPVTELHSLKFEDLLGKLEVAHEDARKLRASLVNGVVNAVVGD